jgi:hypothetical protein
MSRPEQTAMAGPDRLRRGLLKGSAALAAARSLGAGSPEAMARDAARNTPPPAAPDDPTAGRTVIFDEPFARLDTSIWHAGPKATTFDPGFYGRSAFARIGGEEGVKPYAIVDEPAAENGKALRLSAVHIGRRMQVPHYFGNENADAQWISGNIQTARSDGTIMKGWRRGYFEARMKFPRHPLTWPAFWMMNGRSILFPRTSVELDIVEHKGWELQLYGTYLHEWGQPGEHHDGAGVPTDVDLTEGFNRYGMLVDADRCIPYFNRRPVLDQTTRRPLIWTIGRSAELDAQGDVFWPLLTLALRADVPYPSPLREEHRRAHLLVDYMRVYG